VDIIAPDENLIKKLHPSRWYFWQFYFIGFFLIFAGLIFPAFAPLIEEAAFPQIPELSKILSGTNIALFLFGLGAILIVELFKAINTYYVTDKRIVQEYRFLIRRVVSCDHFKIQNINVTQGVIERIVDIGDLDFQTAGWGQSDTAEISFHGVKDPMAIRALAAESKMKIKGE